MRPDPRHPAARQRSIGEPIERDGMITVAQLCELYAISPMTARRDLDVLQSTGRSSRVRGGAVHRDRRHPQLSVPAAIAAEAAEADAAIRTIRDEQIVFLDASPSALGAADALARSGRPVTIVTNSLPVACRLARLDASPATVVLTGGVLLAGHAAFAGPVAEAAVRRRHADYAIVAAPGDGDDARLAAVREAMRANARAELLLQPLSRPDARAD
jgi:DeoR/GlpR family transcriptional regulator of sugar metabolism